MKKINHKFPANDCFEGITQKMLVDWCLKSPFPGNTKWEPEHPIWDSFLPGCLSPRQAWSSREHLELAVDNMYWILTKGIRDGHYQDFNLKHFKALRTCVVKNGEIIDSDEQILRLVLVRFTVAKIAPKVTALDAKTWLKIIDDSGIDLGKYPGIYCPMAGFGGIIEGAKQWVKNNNVDEIRDFEIEAYDINPLFCDYYGWKQRDMLKQVVETDKVCVVCPPFGKNYEHWKGTPDEMSDITYIEWHRLVHEYVKAPVYIIMGPEVDYTGTGSNKGLDSQGEKRNGLFAKTVGVMLWTDDVWEWYVGNKDRQKKSGIK